MRIDTSYRELAMAYLQRAAKAERQKSPLAAYYRERSSFAFRQQARVERASACE